MTVEKNVIKIICTKLLNITGRLSPAFNSRILLLYKTRSFADLKTPGTFPEKISYLKLHVYNKSENVRTLADKKTMRYRLQEMGLGEYLAESYGEYESPEDINWDELPDSFVIKWNFWHGLNLICKDRTQLDIRTATEQLCKYGKTKDYYATGELQYKVDEKMLICERYIDSQHEYKMYYFNGKCKAVLVTSVEKKGDRFGTMYDAAIWERVDMLKNHRYAGEIHVPKPICFGKMKEIGNVIAEKFPFVRVDMILDGERPVVEEITFTPAAGLTPSEAIIDNQTMGDILKI